MRLTEFVELPGSDIVFSRVQARRQHHVDGVAQSMLLMLVVLSSYVSAEAVPTSPLW